jgi:hypothetical protein
MDVVVLLILLAEMLLHGCRGRADSLHRLRQLATGDAKLFRPVPQLVILLNVDAFAILSANFALVVRHIVLRPMDDSDTGSGCRPPP